MVCSQKRENGSPFFSIILAVKDSAWLAQKTIRSLYRQSFTDYEFIVVDGKSSDGTLELIDFWKQYEFITSFVSENDDGVYDAMNKGIGMARGQYVCFMNAGDVFFSDETLFEVFNFLNIRENDGVLGWGLLGNKIYGAWNENASYKIGNLGFCHQSLYVKLECLKKRPFNAKKNKTDSDLVQITDLYSDGCSIEIFPRLLSIRSTDQGLSADIEKATSSAVETLQLYYDGLSKEDALKIVLFRQSLKNWEQVYQILDYYSPRFAFDLCILILDSLVQPDSCDVVESDVKSILSVVLDKFENIASSEFRAILSRFIKAKSVLTEILKDHRDKIDSVNREIGSFAFYEKKRREKIKNIPRVKHDYVISLTSFPDRIKCTHFVIESLLDQTVSPKSIHLWLGADEFPTKTWLPSELLSLERFNVQIHFIPKTYNQYDKFMHNYMLNDEYPFVIVDDDVIYPQNSMESLVLLSKEYPQAVIANRCHLMNIDSTASALPYEEWSLEVATKEPNYCLFPTGAGGVLYPRSFLSFPLARNYLEALKHCPYNDDFWLKCCSLARGIKTFATHLSANSRWYLSYTPTVKFGALHETNIKRGLNDMQMKRVEALLDKIQSNWRECMINDYARVCDANQC